MRRRTATRREPDRRLSVSRSSGSIFSLPAIFSTDFKLTFRSPSSSAPV